MVNASSRRVGIPGGLFNIMLNLMLSHALSIPHSLHLFPIYSPSILRPCPVYSPSILRPFSVHSPPIHRPFTAHSPPIHRLFSVYAPSIHSPSILRLFL